MSWRVLLLSRHCHVRGFPCHHHCTLKNRTALLVYACEVGPCRSGRLTSISMNAIGCAEPFMTSCVTPAGACSFALRPEDVGRLLAVMDAQHGLGQQHHEIRPAMTVPAGRRAGREVPARDAYDVVVLLQGRNCRNITLKDMVRLPAKFALWPNGSRRRQPKARALAGDCSSGRAALGAAPTSIASRRSAQFFSRAETGIGSEIVQLSMTFGLPASVSTIR